MTSENSYEFPPFGKIPSLTNQKLYFLISAVGLVTVISLCLVIRCCVQKRKLSKQLLEVKKQTEEMKNKKQEMDELKQRKIMDQI